MTPRRILLIALAAVGASLMLVTIVYRWGELGDAHAYWLAGQRVISGEPLYDPTVLPGSPYAYWYPPIVAQVLAPITVILPASVFTGWWTLLMLGCLYWLAGRDILVALAMCAFPPIAVEFWFRNVHLIIAVLLVLGLRRWGGWFAVGAAIKISPVLGIFYIGLRGRLREAILAMVLGTSLLAISVGLSPDAWRQFVSVSVTLVQRDAPGYLAIGYLPRVVAGLALALIATRFPPRIGEPLLVVAVVVASPTLWFIALATLAAIVPLVRDTAPKLAPAAEPAPAAPVPAA